jgi:hypothetical protein
MSLKVNSINPLDKNFFGHSLQKFNANKKLSTPVKTKMSSVDDFNRHFQKEIFAMKNSSVQTQSADTFNAEEFTTLPSIF